MKSEQSIRLFKNPLLELLTHVHPIIPLIMWAPVSLYFFYQAYFFSKNSILVLLPVFSIGLLFWTLTEYVIHRYVFHFESEKPLIKRMIYLFHGIHHDDPDDATRLVMPPVPAILIMSLLIYIFYIFVPKDYFYAFTGSFIVGYLAYDYIHYATHHFPMRSKVGKFIKKYHLLHHHAKEDSKYGVSNPLWDYVFRTVTGPKKAIK